MGREKKRGNFINRGTGQTGNGEKKQKKVEQKEKLDPGFASPGTNWTAPSTNSPDRGPKSNYFRGECSKTRRELLYEGGVTEIELLVT